MELIYLIFFIKIFFSKVLFFKFMFLEIQRCDARREDSFTKITLVPSSHKFAK